MNEKYWIEHEEKEKIKRDEQADEADQLYNRRLLRQCIVILVLMLLLHFIFDLYRRYIF